MRADDASQSSTAHHDAVAGGDKAAPPAVDLTGDLAATLAAPHALVVDTDSGADFERVTAVPLGQPGGRRAATDLVCERVNYAGGHGVCVVNDRVGATTGCAVRRRLASDWQRLPRRPSATSRVAPNGKTAAVTTFVVGDAYNIDSFSTRTIFIDVDRHAPRPISSSSPSSAAAGRSIPSTRTSRGVTFAPDSDTFFATMRTGGHYYLIAAASALASAEVLRDGVECPASVARTGPTIAYKSRIEHRYSPATWQLRSSTCARWPIIPWRRPATSTTRPRGSTADHVSMPSPTNAPAARTCTPGWCRPTARDRLYPFARYAQSPVIVP